MERQSQCELILAHLKAGGTLTQLEAYRKPFRCGRLGGRVFDLRQRGYNIQTEMVRVGDGVRVARYFLP